MRLPMDGIPVFLGCLMLLWVNAQDLGSPLASLCVSLRRFLEVSGSFTSHCRLCHHSLHPYWSLLPGSVEVSLSGLLSVMALG